MLIINNVVYISLLLINNISYNIKCYLHIIFYHLSMYYLSKNITERHAKNKCIKEQSKKRLYIFFYTNYTFVLIKIFSNFYIFFVISSSIIAWDMKISPSMSNLKRISSGKFFGVDEKPEQSSS